MIKTASMNHPKREEPVLTIDDLQRLEEEMEIFKALVSEANSRLSKYHPPLFFINCFRMIPNNQGGIQSGENFLQSLGVSNPFEKLALRRISSNMLVDVFEEDNLEESVQKSDT